VWRAIGRAVVVVSDASPYTRLFDTITIIDEADDATRLSGFGASGWRSFTLHDRTNFALTLKAVLAPTMTFTLSVEPGRFDTDFASRVAGLMKRLLHQMAARPEATLGELPRLPARDERALASFNRTSVQVLAPGSVHECVEAQVDRTPDAVALVYRDQSLTYRELDERANRVATELVALGVGPDQTVGVFVDRSLETVVGLLGILKAGGAYVPLDPSHPSDRIAMMLEDSRPGVVLTVDRLRGALPPLTGQVVILDALGPGRSCRVRSAVRSDHLAYVIYTSGSTGRPKGVQVEHRNVVNFFSGMDEVLGTTPGVWLALAPIFVKNKFMLGDDFLGLLLADRQPAGIGWIVIRKLEGLRIVDAEALDQLAEIHEAFLFTHTRPGPRILAFCHADRPALSRDIGSNGDDFAVFGFRP
jgi:non-ribosomal peptide synthetase component F